MIEHDLHPRVVIIRAHDSSEVEIDVSVHTTLSSAFEIDSYAVMGLLVPTLDAGSNLKFYASDAIDGTYRKVVNASDGTDFTVDCGASGNVAIASDELSALAAYEFMKIETTEVQTADRTFKVILKM